MNLAKLIIRDFHSQKDAESAEEEFNRRFVKKEVPEEIEERLIEPGSYRLANLLVEIGLAASKADAKRLIEQGGVRIDGEKVVTSSPELTITNGGPILLQAGKLRFLRIIGK